MRHKATWAVVATLMLDSTAGYFQITVDSTA
jgi:hypothetical protein